jgi:factor associated with neutral sphingomyelinase activation
MQTSLEIYTSNSSIIFTFKSNEMRENIYSKITSLEDYEGTSLEDLDVMTTKWENGLLSNFDYLMFLNLYVGNKKFNIF